MNTAGNPVRNRHIASVVPEKASITFTVDARLGPGRSRPPAPRKVRSMFSFIFPPIKSSFLFLQVKRLARRKEIRKLIHHVNNLRRQVESPEERGLGFAVSSALASWSSFLNDTLVVDDSE